MSPGEFDEIVQRGREGREKFFEEMTAQGVDGEKLFQEERTKF